MGDVGLAASYKYTSLKKEEIQEKIKYLAYHDNLTGLPNRLFFKNQLDCNISELKGSDKTLTVMFLDVDEFKMINDSKGHTVGDKLLIEVSKRLTQIIKEGNVVARIGGNEFAIMIKNIKSSNDVEKINEIMRFGNEFSWL